MKTINRICVSLTIGMLAILAGPDVAHAGKVTVNYRPFPTGAPFATNTPTQCETSTANSYPDYEFLFWDNQGTLSWSPTVTICPGSGNTVANAWYLPTGCAGVCACPPSGCYITTFAFSIDHNEVLAGGTSIATVAPNSPVAWTSPMTTVLTNDAENVTANSAVAFPPYAAEPFRYWQQLGASTPTPDGAVYAAVAGSTAWVVAFYGPDPCQTIRAELQSCLEGDGEGGKLNCTPFGRELQECEILNRELE